MLERFRDARPSATIRRAQSENDISFHLPSDRRQMQAEEEEEKSKKFWLCSIMLIPVASPHSWLEHDSLEEKKGKKAALPDGYIWVDTSYSPSW